ncbi:MAG TPA: hypothetical protein VK568_17045 [Thermodesulfobacteriota bacterium]|jgi:hypothetical protein|nr:hypothetical protein [Thermodesulfobacteriota bacterium]
MPRKGSKQPYKPKKEYRYTVKDIAELAGITRNAVGVAKAHGKVDPGDFKSVVSFLTRKIIDKRLSGDLFSPAARTAKRVKRDKNRARVSGKKSQKAARRK